MKKSIFLSVIITLSLNLFAQNNIGIGTQTPHASAVLDVSSTSKGLLAPRMTSAQRSAVSSPAKGLLVYDTDVNSLYHYNGAAWVSMAGGGGGFSLPFDANVNLNVPTFQIQNSGTGDVLFLGAGAGSAINAFNTGNAAAINVNATNGFGVYAQSFNSIPVFALSTNANNTLAAMRANNNGGGVGLHATSANNDGILAISSAANKMGIRGEATGNGGIGVYGTSTSTTGTGVSGLHAGNGTGVLGTSTSGYGVRGVTSSGIGFSGVYGENNGTTGAGVRGVANFSNGTGVSGSSTTGIGVGAFSESNRAVQAQTNSGTALFGTSTSGYGLDVSGKVKISGGNTSPAAGAVLTSMDANGNAVWKTNRIGFDASSSFFFNQIVNDEATTILAFDEKPFDPGNNFNLNSAVSDKNTFIVPVSGFYHLDASCRITLNSTTTNLQDGSISVYVNGTFLEARGSFAANNSSTDSKMPMSISTSRHFNAGDKITIRVWSNNFTSLNVKLDENRFSGFLVFAD